jgi:acetoin utilization deacetylase AcuC-like enzyme
VLVSAGFDAHRSDPLAELALSSGDFAALARSVSAYAPAPGRLVLFLEGGYDLAALRSSVRATLGALAGAPTTVAPGSGEPERPTSGGPGSEFEAAAVAERRRALGVG